MANWDGRWDAWDVDQTPHQTPPDNHAYRTYRDDQATAFILNFITPPYVEDEYEQLKSRNFSEYGVWVRPCLNRRDDERDEGDDEPYMLITWKCPACNLYVEENLKSHGDVECDVCMYKGIVCWSGSKFLSNTPFMRLTPAWEPLQYRMQSDERAHRNSIAQYLKTCEAAGPPSTSKYNIDPEYDFRALLPLHFSYLSTSKLTRVEDDSSGDAIPPSLMSDFKKGLLSGLDALNERIFYVKVNEETYQAVSVKPNRIYSTRHILDAMSGGKVRSVTIVNPRTNTETLIHLSFFHPVNPTINESYFEYKLPECFTPAMQRKVFPNLWEIENSIYEERWDREKWICLNPYTPHKYWILYRKPRPDKPDESSKCMFIPKSTYGGYDIRERDVIIPVEQEDMEEEDGDSSFGQWMIDEQINKATFVCVARDDINENMLFYERKMVRVNRKIDVREEILLVQPNMKAFRVLPNRLKLLDSLSWGNQDRMRQVFKIGRESWYVKKGLITEDEADRYTHTLSISNNPVKVHTFISQYAVLAIFTGDFDVTGRINDRYTRLIYVYHLINNSEGLTNHKMMREEAAFKLYTKNFKYENKDEQQASIYVAEPVLNEIQFENRDVRISSVGMNLPEAPEFGGPFVNTDPRVSTAGVGRHRGHFENTDARISSSLVPPDNNFVNTDGRISASDEDGRRRARRPVDPRISSSGGSEDNVTRPPYIDPRISSTSMYPRVLLQPIIPQPQIPQPQPPQPQIPQPQPPQPQIPQPQPPHPQPPQPQPPPPQPRVLLQPIPQIPQPQIPQPPQPQIPQLHLYPRVSLRRIQLPQPPAPPPAQQPPPLVRAPVYGLNVQRYADAIMGRPDDSDDEDDEMN